MWRILSQDLMKRNKGLKIWNGRGCFICAESVAEAVRLVNSVFPHHITRREIDIYFFEGCWGNTMEGIEKSKGVWVTRGHNGKPEKVI